MRLLWLVKGCEKEGCPKKRDRSPLSCVGLCSLISKQMATTFCNFKTSSSNCQLFVLKFGKAVKVVKAMGATTERQTTQTSLACGYLSIEGVSFGFTQVKRCNVIYSRISFSSYSSKEALGPILSLSICPLSNLSSLLPSPFSSLRLNVPPK